MVTENIHKTTNNLINEKSPYLLQHAHNPVDWYPWGAEAFSRAISDDRPIFLSIGYSTCHWCHVMEKESFEDKEVAEVLNKYFIAIKVDKEERPDIDSIYMSVCQALTGSGGWPMTIIMTPEKKPFYAGTYFPKVSKYGRPGLMDVLYSVEEAWTTRREELIESSKTIVEAVAKSETRKSNENKLNIDTLEKAYKELKNNFDPEFGGMGDAPKFPIPHNLLYLLRYNYSFGEKKALEIVEKTLESMYKGGIFDHIGFGFARYSVDRKWLVPHFEKMLYDNALLALAYVETYNATKNEFYKEVAEKIFNYILRDMTSKEGGFFSAEDADSEGVEGKFYLWDIGEVIKVLGEDNGKFFCKYYGISDKGNFEKKNIPNLISRNLDKLGQEEKEKLESLRQILFEYREKRVHPHKDDKILTSWNGLMIAALSYGGRVLNNKNYIEAAERAVNFILKELIKEDGRLLARYRDDDAAYLGYLDDYAFLIWGLIELYETTLNTIYLEKALELNKDMLRLFSDEEDGGFYLYGIDAEELIIRPKEIYDGALPSGNSVAAYNLIRLAKITGDSFLQNTVEKLFENFAGIISYNPSSYTLALIAFMFNLKDTKEIVIAGSKSDIKAQEYLKIVNARYLPFSTLVLNDRDDRNEKIQSLVENKQMLENKATVYICENFTCGVPITDTNKFINALNIK